MDIDMKTMSVCSVIFVKANRMLRTSREGVENKTVNITVLLHKSFLWTCLPHYIQFWPLFLNLDITKPGRLERRNPNAWNHFSTRMKKLRLFSHEKG